MQPIIDYLEHLSQTVSPELFVISGALIEEIIAPIPSSVVLTTAGGLLRAQAYPWYWLILIALLAGSSKALAATGFYFLADKLEDRIPPKIRTFFGLQKHELETYGTILSKNQRSFWVLLLLWSSPLPTLPISLVSGFIKIKWHSFITAAIIGLSIRSTGYLILGYQGTKYLTELSQEVEYDLLLLSPILLLAVIIFLYLRKKQNKKSPKEWVTDQLKQLLERARDAE